MIIITLRQILILHEWEIAGHGGSSGVCDMQMLESAINRPFATFAGNDLYKNVFLKSGALIQSIVKNHPFVDGNKRTAYVSAVSFLELNKISVKIAQKEVVNYMIKVANENLSVDEIANWLKKHSKKI